MSSRGGFRLWAGWSQRVGPARITIGTNLLRSLCRPRRR